MTARPAGAPPGHSVDIGRARQSPGRAARDSRLRAPIPPGFARSLAAARPLVALAPSAAVALGTGLRLIPWLAAYPLHRDEALYGTWARLIAGGQDPLLLTPWVDKPPLVPYLIAGSLKLFGVSSLALRLPGILAGVLALIACYGLARRAYSGENEGTAPGTATLATFLLAVSPFAILFAPTAFTDPWLALWLLLAAWAALGEHPLAAGLALGLAVASKQQGVLAIPLVLALLLARVGTTRPVRRLRTLASSLAGFALIMAPLTYWDSLRWSNRSSFWERSATTYGGLALAPLAQWPQRAAEWGQQLGYLYCFPALSALMLLLAGCAGVAALARLLRARAARRIRPAPSAAPRAPGSPAPAGLGSQSGGPALADRVDALLALYLLGYLALHFLLSFQPWDRYLLPVVPLLAILAARGLQRSWRWRRALQAVPLQLARYACAAGLAAFLASAAWLGAGARLPIGSDHGAYFGLERIVADLRAQPADAVIYHQWLGWHYDYYLFDAPQERRWWGNPWKLADDAAATARSQPWRTQWLAVPGWEDEAAGPLQLALSSRGLRLAEHDRTYRPDGSLSFTLYQIVSAGQRGS